MFLGLALDKLDRNEESEASYNTAVKSKGNESLAWQGLITLFEKQASKKLDEYRNAAVRLAEVFMNAYVRMLLSLSPF